jgi:UDP-N-acetylglucosamine 1-carboxyvinyltransferase
VTIDRMRPSDVRWLINKLRSAGADVAEGASEVRVRGGRVRAVDVTTWPHPGFATDLQPQYCALMTQATGTSIVSEALYENRFRHVPALLDFGARISVEGRSAIIEGPVQLHATCATVPDIRSGAALVIAALCAHGTSDLDGVYHLDRGYESLDEKLRGLGADVQRIPVDGSGPAVRDLSGVVGD